MDHAVYLILQIFPALGYVSEGCVALATSDPSKGGVDPPQNEELGANFVWLPENVKSG